MQLFHVPTLMMVIVILGFAQDLFFLIGWLSRRDRTIYAWMSLSSVSCSIGTVLLILRGPIPEWFSIMAGQGLLMLSGGLLWTGIRAFRNRPNVVLVTVGGMLIWCFLCLFPVFTDSLVLRTITISLMVAAYHILFAIEIYQSYKVYKLNSQIIAITCCLGHAIASLGRMGYLLSATALSWDQIMSTMWIPIFIVESIVNIAIISLSLVSMERDKAEYLQRTAADTDVMTGLLNRRAFVERAKNWIEQRGQDAALLLFDLDHFKKINDTFGHSAGDRALTAFADTVSAELNAATIQPILKRSDINPSRRLHTDAANPVTSIDPAEIIFARIGGEEFACLIPQITTAQGAMIAEHIRECVNRAKVLVVGQTLTLTVSIGVVSSHDRGHYLESMLAEADNALYRAKRSGRNRVEITGAETSASRMKLSA